ncbi:hypothetical protein NMS_0019 [Nonlabens marinus S1-08]|uniref:Uncharacterized protein n=1 Tax=Nonlabens marinus S1-08 TaxID=1454201 RepID=W8VTV1_9FLAO|nr:hypothetical protein NMS_0019 [Nonlabens marinus S1-08]
MRMNLLSFSLLRKRNEKEVHTALGALCKQTKINLAAFY